MGLPPPLQGCPFVQCEMPKFFDPKLTPPPKTVPEPPPESTPSRWRWGSPRSSNNPGTRSTPPPHPWAALAAGAAGAVHRFHLQPDRQVPIHHGGRQRGGPARTRAERVPPPPPGPGCGRWTVGYPSPFNKLGRSSLRVPLPTGVCPPPETTPKPMENSVRAVPKH